MVSRRVREARARARRRRVVSITAATTVAVLALFGGSYAYLGAGVTSDAQGIESGTASLSLDDSADRVEFAEEVRNVAAGDSVVRYVDLRNSGTLPLSRLSASQTNGGGPLVVSDVLSTSVASCSVPWTRGSEACSTGSVPVLSSSLASWTSPIDASAIGPLAAGATAYLRFETTLAAGATNDLQGAVETVRYSFGALAGSSRDLPALTGLTATLEGGDHVLAWSPVESAESYRVTWSGDESGTEDVTGTEFRREAEPGSTVEYVVAPLRGASTGPAATATVSSVAATVGTPRVTRDASGVATLAWSPAPYASGYRVTLVDELGETRELEASGTSLVLPDLAPGASYSASVSSVNASGVSSPSAPVRVLVAPSSTTTPTVEYRSVENDLLLSFDAVRGATSYDVVRGGKVVATISDSAARVARPSVSLPLPTERASYSVVARSAAGAAPASAEASYEPSAPSAPRNVAVTPEGEGAVVSYDEPAEVGDGGVSEYRVTATRDGDSVAPASSEGGVVFRLAAATDYSVEVVVPASARSATFPTLEVGDAPVVFTVTAVGRAGGVVSAAPATVAAPTVSGSVDSAYVEDGVDYSCATGVLTSNSTSSIPSCVVAPVDYPATETVSYSCPSGGNLGGTSCVTPASTYPATGTTSYACPTGGSLGGTSCAVPASSYAASASTSYACPSGGSLSGASCALPASTYAATGTTTYSCPASTGGSLSGTSCAVPASSYPATATTTYSCPSGGSVSGTSCAVPSSTYTASSSTYYSCPSGGSLSGTTCSTGGSSYSATATTTYRCGVGTYVIGRNCYYSTNGAAAGAATAVTTYTCPSGGSLSGTTCYTSGSSYTATANTTYSCSGSDTRSGTTCTRAASSYTATAATTYSCPTATGGTLSGTSCAVPASSYAAASSTAYTCPTGGSLAGTSCSVPASTYAATGTTSYSCTGTDPRSGTSCTRPASSYTAAASTAYTCPSGGSLDSTTCRVPSVTAAATPTSTFSCSPGATRASRVCTTPGTSVTAAGKSYGHDVYSVTPRGVSGARFVKVVTDSGTVLAPGRTDVGACPGSVTLRAYGLGGVTKTSLATALCSTPRSARTTA